MTTFYRTAGALLTAWMCCAPVHADETLTQGYTVITPTATAEQNDILSVVIVIKFPATVQTVGEAVNTLLDRSGYRLVYGAQGDPALPTLLALPLPQVHRNIGPIRLRDALQALAGSSWILVEDPVNRLIGYDLDPRFSAPGDAPGVTK